MKGIHLNKSFQINANFNNLIKNLEQKDEALFSRKSFLEIILGLIKEALMDLLNKTESKKNKEKMAIMKNILIDLKGNLKEIKIEKEKKMKIYSNRKDEKQLNLKHLIVNNKKIRNRRRLNSDLSLSSNTIITNEISFNKNNAREEDIKIKNFILENQLIEIDNLTKRLKYLIEFNKKPHKIEDHFTEKIIKNKNDITDNLKFELFSIRGQWKDVATKKNMQEERLVSLQSKINYLKENGKKMFKNNKYVNTEDIIQEENFDNETIQDEIVKKDENFQIKNNKGNLEVDINNDDMKNLKLDFGNIEKLLKLNMNISVNINLNKQYVNNHFNQINSKFFSDNYKSKINDEINDRDINNNNKNNNI